VSRSNGVVIYEGTGMDAGPIACVVILESRNQKTGPCLQQYIFRADLPPPEAAARGLDASCCGNCGLRGRVERLPGQPFELTRNVERECYLLLWREVLQVWREYHAGHYPRFTHPGSIRALGYGRAVRLGAYGDPAAVPRYVHEELIADARLALGYTHQWRSRPDLKAFCMASVDSVAEAAEALALGWRCYRTVRVGDVEQLAGEVICPGSVEAGQRLTCIECRHCDGARTGRNGSVCIRVHGSSTIAAVAAWRKVRA
jgi:hypothetical protein